MNETVKAPSKINFGLNVVKKRKDGFHNIETIFYPISLSDILTFSYSNEYIFETDNNILNSEKDNLITKTKEILEKHTGKTINVKIHLSKNIPIGAGLGGGSSDAATTLITLNKLFKFGLDSVELNKLALELGSDVPFFLNPYPSYGTSRGEILEQIDFKIKESILLINPGIFVSTKWAYEKITPLKPQLSLIDYYRRAKLNLENYQDIIKNDFEKPVINEFQAIGKLKEEICEAGADFVLMSGSGSSLFGLFADMEKAKIAKVQFEKRFFTYLQEA
jgi:4-diphosphocytidyl-2-C-methyl-D-erythritol kinase